MLRIITINEEGGFSSVSIFSAYLFLGANGSPFGGSSKSGGVPGIDSRRSLVKVGIELIKPQV